MGRTAPSAARVPVEKKDPPVILVTATVMLGLIMAIIDTSIVNVALNTMAGNLGATIDEISWVATGYILANVVIMPLNGWLTAYFGRKRYYATCIALFTIASFLCGTAGLHSRPGLHHEAQRLDRLVWPGHDDRRTLRDAVRVRTRSAR